MLVELKAPVILTSNVNTICIPNKEDPEPNSLAGKSATMVGFGPDTKGSTTLNQFLSTIKAQQFCAFRYNPNKANSDKLIQNP